MKLLLSTFLLLLFNCFPTFSQDLMPQTFVRLEDLDDSFIYDMRYASDNNFIGQTVYTCDDCLVRKEVARALIRVNDYFKSLGYSIKFYDCYRPLDIQKKMWYIYPDARYVANPKTGSNHNRGTAVDITLVDVDGKELDMGTGFDYFGEKAHHTYLKLSGGILKNRKTLKEGMEANGFTAIRTEWWHYNFRPARRYKISNFQAECN